MENQTKTNSRNGVKICLDFIQMLFVRLGVLPFLLVIAVIVFALSSDNFLSGRNLLNVVRQSSYLTLVAVGQMFALLTGGFDLSVGTIVALTSVFGATAMVAFVNIMPEFIWLAIILGMIAGIMAGALIGAINGIGVAIFGVSPFYDDSGNVFGWVWHCPLYDRWHACLWYAS